MILDKHEGEVPLPRDDRDDDLVGVRECEGSDGLHYDPGDGAECVFEEDFRVYPVMAGGREKIASTAKSSGGDRRLIRLVKLFQYFPFIITIEFRLYTQFSLIDTLSSEL